LIEEYCQGLVKFVEPDVKKNLECVATHVAAKKKLQEIVWLIKNGRTDVLERGILLPGRIGVGKSYLIYCFASECGLPVMEIGDFRSKWVGDTEKQQSRILMTIKALGPVIVVVDEADAVFGNRHADGDSGVSSRVFAGFAAHIGDSSLRGREVWIAMTSRPDMMAIDMKRQGRFGLCIPLFPSQNVDEAMDLFAVQAKINKVELTEESKNYIKDWYWRYQKELTGSDVEAIVLRAKERAALESRNNVTEEDFKNAVDTFIDPLDPILLNLQMLAAVLACSDKRYLPQRFVDQDRGELYKQFLQAKMELQML
jgi:SpoVK/Ycf46/Vps4 family AAA+-type ATPase